MKGVRFTAKQKEFLESLHETGNRGFWECHKEEARTARSLAEKGLVEFESESESGNGPDDGDDYFMARLTEHALKMLYGEPAHEQCTEDLAQLREEFLRVHEIAQRLDSSNPSLPGAFAGTVSERIVRQIQAHGVPGFASTIEIESDPATDAVQLLRDHSLWLAKSWGLSPEGREYKIQFDAAISAIESALRCRQESRPKEFCVKQRI